MATPNEQLLRHIRRLVSRPASSPDADAVLLDRFVRQQDQDAFAALVRRHGPLVLGVCRRVLRDAHLAEDAAQAVFLVLARKAAAIRPPDRLAAWLHGVARHLACNVRRADVRRRRQETCRARDARRRSPADPLDEITARELLTILDEELQQLPEVYRSPMILCCLQGCSQEQAAAQLGWTPGSVKGRLERGRAKLRERLMKRGVEWTAAFLALETVQGAQSAAVVPMGFVTSTLRAAMMFAIRTGAVDGRITTAAALAEEGMRSLTTAKARILAALLLAVSVAAGVGTMAQVIHATRQLEEYQEAQANPEPRRVGPAQAKEQARTDRYGDPLPTGAIARLGTIRLRRGYKVYSLPQRDTFLSVLQQHDSIQVCKWRMSTGELLHDAEYQLSRGTASHIVSSDGKMLAAQGIERRPGNLVSVIRIWDLSCGKVLREIEKPEYYVRAIAFSPDGTMLAAADEDQTLRLWDIKSKTELRRSKETKDRFDSITFSPDGKILASTSLSLRTIRLWDTATLRELRALDDGPGTAPHCMVFSPDSKTLVAATGDEMSKTIHLWDVVTGKEVRQFHSELGTGALAFSPDGDILAVGGGAFARGNISRHGRDHWPIYLYEVSSGREVHRLPGHSSAVFSLIFSSNGKRLVSAGGGFVMKVWDVGVSKEVVPLSEHQEWIHTVAFSPDGRQVATGGLDGGIGLWEAATGKQVRMVESGVGPGVVAFAPDGRTVISGHSDGSLRFWNAATGREIRRLQVGVEDDFCLFACSSDGRSLAARSKNGAIALLDAVSGAEKRRLTGGMKGGTALAFSPEGGKLASMSFESRDSGHILQVWDVATGTEILKRTFTFQTPLVFSADGKTLFGILSDTRRGAVNPSLSLRMWDMTGEPDRTCKIPQPAMAESLAASPDGRMLAWADFEGTITLWDLVANQVRRRFKDHSNRIPSLAFSPDGKTLASGSVDTTVLIWDVTGRSMTRHFVALSPERLPSLWDDLASKDAAKAFDAIGLLTAMPEQALPLLKAKLKPAPVRADSKQIARLIADLDNERFEKRQEAMEELDRVGEQAEPALRAALAAKPSLEARKRIDELLEGVRALSATPERLRELRAVEILEHIGTSGARQLLRTLAEGSPAARLTREAKTSVDRLSRQEPVRTP